MNLLIDTHAIIWFITDNTKLPRKTKNIISSEDNNCFVSIASFWEIGIKHSIGRLKLGTDLKTIFRIIEDTGFKTLPLNPEHILKNSILPFYHQDPFDRILIAQALTENMLLISRDRQFKNYPVQVIWDG